MSFPRSFYVMCMQNESKQVSLGSNCFIKNARISVENFLGIMGNFSHIMPYSLDNINQNLASTGLIINE